MLADTRLSARKPYTLCFFREADNAARTEEVLRFRKNILVDVHGWSLSVAGDMERDEFDRPHTTHAALYRHEDLIGAFRALRADRDYLSCVKFPDLAQDTPYTKSALSWEISRLTVASGEKRFQTSMLVYAAMFHFITLRGGRSIVGFCDIAHQRLLKRIGIETHPYGRAQQIGVDAMGRPIIVIAGEMPLPTSPSLKFQKLMSLVTQMEVHDEVTLLGYSSLSA